MFFPRQQCVLFMFVEVCLLCKGAELIDETGFNGCILSILIGKIYLAIYRYLCRLLARFESCT